METGDGGEDDATSQSSAHFVSVQSQISKVRTLRGWALTQSLSLRVFVSFDFSFIKLHVTLLRAQLDQADSLVSN